MLPKCRVIFTQVVHTVKLTQKNKGTMFEKSIVSYFTLHIYEAFGGGIFLCGKPAPEKCRVRQQFWLE